MTRTIGGVVVCVVLACAASASAQDQKPALTMAYPAAVGVLLPVGGSWAVRPELSFSTRSSDPYVPGSGTNDSFSISTGVSLLYYLHQADGFRTYVSPHFSYYHSSYHSSAPVGLDGSTYDSTGKAWDLTGSFGAQYALGPRFGVFGEVGVGYSHTTNSSNSPLLGDTHSHGVGTSAGVGVLVSW